LLLVVPRRAVATTPRVRPSFTKVVGVVWLPGFGLALSRVGFGAITTFIVLLFAQHGWGQAWLALTAVSTAFVLGRVVFGHLPDRIGGAKVALVCILIEAAGQALIWLAPCARAVRRNAYRLRLLARLPRLWRGSGPPHAAGKSWPRHRSLHCFSR